jgi:hypothetical protein
MSRVLPAAAIVEHAERAFDTMRRSHFPQTAPRGGKGGASPATPAHEAKLRQIEEMNRKGLERVGTLSDEALFVAGIALHAGEGSKTDGEVRFSNSDPEMVRLFCTWFRRFFDVDEARIRGRLYLHQGFDLDAAEAFWSTLASIPTTQFHKPYRAVPDPCIRRNKHEHGCFSVGYGCSRTRREVMGLVRALLSSEALPG